MSDNPSAYELWVQADGDRDRYRQMCRDHGLLIPGKPEPLPCDRTSMAERSPADEIRLAVETLRNPLRCGNPEHMEAEAELLDAIADGMDELGAVEGSASGAVHPTTPLGLGAPNRSWTAALAVARSIGWLGRREETADAS